MKSNNTIKESILLAVMLGSVMMAGGQEPAHPAKFTVRLTDDGGTPLKDYPVQIGTFDRKETTLHHSKETWNKVVNNTDSAGSVTFEHASETGEFGINLFTISIRRQMTGMLSLIQRKTSFVIYRTTYGLTDRSRCNALPGHGIDGHRPPLQALQRRIEETS